MIKRVLLSIGISLSVFGRAFSQSNIQTFSGRLFYASEASFLNPSFLKDTRNIQINVGPLMGMNAQVSNDFVSVGSIIDYVGTEEQVNAKKNAAVHEFMDNLNPVNSVQAAADFTLLHVNFGGRKSENSLRFGLSVRQHVHANTSLNDTFFKLLYGGNKQFAGRSVSFDPLLSGISYTDIGLAVSKTLQVRDLKITPGARLRFLIGNGAAYTDKTGLEIYTHEEGEYLELTGHFRGYTGGLINGESIVDGKDLEIETKDLLKSMGKGFALDLGVTVEFKNISLSLASVDNGSIRFKEENGWLIESQNQSFRFEGYDLKMNENGTEVDDPAFKFKDSLDLKAMPGKFNTNPGSKLTFNGNYGLTKREDKKGREYYMHNVGLSYIQGFKNLYNANTSPYYAVYYQLNLGNRFTAGANLNGRRKMHDAGLNIGFRLAAINFGIGSNSLIGAFDTHSAKQADMFFQLGLAF